LTVEDLSYLSGDSAPAYGYNAREFGDGVLDDADYNNALYASMGIRVPPLYSDAFNALDVWPQTPLQSGNLKIDINDCYHILLRAEGLEQTNWLRFWTNSGFVYAVPTLNGEIGNPADPTQAAAPISPPGLVWYPQASLTVGSLTNVTPGSSCSLPVSVNILPGCSLAGLQFRTVVSPVGNAPVLGGVHFGNLAGGLPSPSSLRGLNTNDILTAWTPGELYLEGSNYIGSINFQVPSTTTAGQCYAVHFIGTSGTPDGDTEYTMESFPGYVWVRSTALTTPSVTSDDWKVRFFGSISSPLAADNVDADGDGVPNWQEYLAGTDPMNSSSVLAFAKSDVSSYGPNGVALNWLTAPGKNYILESIPAIGGKTWTAINTNAGDGYYYQFIQTKINSNAQYYRIRLKP
jgi:hypothetical protein